MISDIEKTQLQTLLVKGFINSEKIQEADVIYGMELISKVAKENSKYLLLLIKDLVQIKIDGMVSLALAYLTCQGDEDFLDKTSSQDFIIGILSIYDPRILLEYVTYLKSKDLGRGLGSRPQKWVREVMLTWTDGTLQQYVDNFLPETCELTRLIHPRWQGRKGEIIKRAMEIEKYGLPC